MGYNWESFQIDGRTFLGYADHVSDSLLFKWDGSAFVPFQSFAPKAGRCFRFLPSMTNITRLRKYSRRFDAVPLGWRKIPIASKAERPQRARTPRGQNGQAALLVQINSSRASRLPETDLRSRIYRWEKDQFSLVEEFATAGATDAAAFRADGRLYLAVSNSLTPEVRFRTDTIIYSFNG